MTPIDEARLAFMQAATWHGSLERAEAILAENPELAGGDIFTAAILGDDARVRQVLATDHNSATIKGGPYDAEPLVYLCLSKYFRLNTSRSDGFLRAATALLDAGADPNAGFWMKGEFETALYGAAGVAHHVEMTHLLLERGGMPDEEVAYHAPEGYDNDAMKLLVQSAKLSDESLTTMLVRKIDWHDAEGVKWLLENGVKPHQVSHWGFAALAHALHRDNSLKIIALLLDHGADPTVVANGKSGVALAARGGRSDVLEAFERRRISIELEGVDKLIAACAMGDAERVRAIAQREPDLVCEIQAEGGKLLAEFAGTGNPPGVRQLLDVGVDVKSLYEEGDGYWGIAENSMAIHVAAWRLCHSVVKLLIERGSPVDVPDGRGRTPLQLAVRGCVDSYWTEYRSPESVRALLGAGASVKGAQFPSGYEEVDELLKAHGATASTLSHAAVDAVS